MIRAKFRSFRSRGSEGAVPDLLKKTKLLLTTLNVPVLLCTRPLRGLTSDPPWPDSLEKGSQKGTAPSSCRIPDLKRLLDRGESFCQVWSPGMKIRLAAIKLPARCPIDLQAPLSPKHDPVNGIYSHYRTPYRLQFPLRSSWPAHPCPRWRSP